VSLVAWGSSGGGERDWKWIGSKLICYSEHVKGSLEREKVKEQNKKVKKNELSAMKPTYIKEGPLLPGKREKKVCSYNSDARVRAGDSET